MTDQQPENSGLRKDTPSSRSETSGADAARPPETEVNAALADFEKLAALAESYSQRVRDNLHTAVVQARQNREGACDHRQTWNRATSYPLLPEPSLHTAQLPQSTFATHNVLMKRFRKSHPKVIF